MRVRLEPSPPREEPSLVLFHSDPHSSYMCLYESTNRHENDLTQRKTNVLFDQQLGDLQGMIHAKELSSYSGQTDSRGNARHFVFEIYPVRNTDMMKIVYKF